MEFIILEKKEGRWSQEEINRLAEGGMNIRNFADEGKTVVLNNKPPCGKTFQGILGHSDFTQQEVRY